MTTATQRFENLYLNTVKQACILEEQIELMAEQNNAQTELITELKKELAKKDRALNRK